MSDIFDLSLAWLHAGGPHGYTIRQLAVLAVVMKADTPPRVRELARELRVPKPIITRAVTALETAGLVERRRGEDKRDRFVAALPRAHVFRNVMGGTTNA